MLRHIDSYTRVFDAQTPSHQSRTHVEYGEFEQRVLQLLRVDSGSDAAVGRVNLPLVVQDVVLAIELQEKRGPFDG